MGTYIDLSCYSDVFLQNARRKLELVVIISCKAAARHADVLTATSCQDQDHLDVILTLSLVDCRDKTRSTLKHTHTRVKVNVHTCITHLHCKEVL